MPWRLLFFGGGGACCARAVSRCLLISPSSKLTELAICWSTRVDEVEIHVCNTATQSPKRPITQACVKKSFVSGNQCRSTNIPEKPISCRVGEGITTPYPPPKASDPLRKWTETTDTLLSNKIAAPA